ncbi:arylsulfatase [Rapidithrix thailandica]|uniref:Arylsulfatase n=1 Tax=Rapidithrix thailandica TaxID=413964 RepID=A0AAW9S1Y3_9BACT
MYTYFNLFFKYGLAIVFSCQLLACKSSQKEEKKRPPNIVYILADDMGYGDVAALNHRAKIPTPHLDKLVEQGRSFTDAHTNSAVCTPTRYGVLTGRYCFRSRLKSGVLVGHEPALIEKGRMTVGSLLKQAGYHTGAVGKWHLGLDWQAKDSTQALFEGNLWDMSSTENVDYTALVKGGPADYGFDYEYIIPASLDIAPYVYIENQKVTAAVNRHVDFWKDTTSRGAWYRHGDIAEDFDHSDVLPQLTRKAVTYIHDQAKQKEPFFLYFPLTAPHTPWLPSEEFQGKSQAGVYGDFVAMVDHTVGQVIQALKENGVLENTLVIFTSDNGAHWLPSDIETFNHEANHGRSGMKSDVWDGGHRVPFIVHWPERVPAATISDEVICTTDLMATCAALTGLEMPHDAGEDSYNVLPAFLGQTADQPIREATIHHGIDGMFAIRKGKWKFIDGKGSGGWSAKPTDEEPAGQLYDMESDPLEKNNLYEGQPDKVKELKTLLEKYKSQGYSRSI